MPEEAVVEAPEAPEAEVENAPPAAPMEGMEPEGGWQKYAQDMKAYADRQGQENKAYREKYQPIERTFANEATKPFLAAAEAMASGNADAVSEWVVRNAAAALGVEPDVLMALAEEGEFEDDEDADDVESTVERMLNERLGQMEQAQTEAQTEAIFEDLKEMGYEQGTFEANSVLWLALNQTGGDLEAAKKAFEEFQQKPVDAYVESKREAARQSTRQASGAAPSSERKIKLEDAGDAALEYLENLG